MFHAKNGVYVLRVRGESMIEDHLCDGDYVVIERRETARNGEQVVALLDSGEATLKRFYREGGKIRLQPANSSMAPRIVDADRCKVQGVVIGVLRRLKRHRGIGRKPKYFVVRKSCLIKDRRSRDVV
jgi:SOS regulatory protein LexA